MWRPSEDLDAFNRLIVALEKEYLLVLQGQKKAVDLLHTGLLRDVCALVDANPYQAVVFARIKSGHAMTPRHGINVMLLARAWVVSSHKLGSRLDDFTLAALCHDLGHWRPDDLIYVTEAFSHEQARNMQGHTQLDEAEFEGLDPAIRDWIAQHHEQPDGRGYPHGLVDPPLLSQVIRIADCFEGLTSPRRFRPAWTWYRALVLMSRWAGMKFERGLFASFHRFLGTYPPGTFIRLQNGAAAVVLPGGHPQVTCLVLTQEDGDCLPEPGVEILAAGAIAGEGQSWFETNLPETWRNLRPDLAGLPRGYT